MSVHRSAIETAEGDKQLPDLPIMHVLLIPQAGSLVAKGISRRRHVFDGGHERFVTAAARSAPPLPRAAATPSSDACQASAP